MKKAPALLLALVVAAVRGDKCSSYDWDDKVGCESDSDCVYTSRWWSCVETCEGRDEDACEEVDHCAFSDSSNTCSLSCEHKYFDGYYYNDEDDCAADSDCVWVAHSVLRL